MKRRQPFLRECHDCHEGVVIPGSYKNIHGETVKIDPKTFDPDTEVFGFDHHSIVPLFHHSIGWHYSKWHHNKFNFK